MIPPNKTNGMDKSNLIKVEEDQFLEEFRSEIKKARGKTTLVAIHHPMFSNGSHAGQYTVKSNMSPLPVLGTIKNVLRIRSMGSLNLSERITINRINRGAPKVIIKVKVRFISSHSLALIIQKY